MHSLAKEIGPDQLDTYYTAGLFHGIGKLVINQYLRPRGLFLYGGHDGEGESMRDIGPEIETKILGFDNTEVGAAFLTSWQFPTDIVKPIRFQITPQSSESHRKISHALHFSRNTASLLSVVAKAPENIEVSDDLLSALEIDKECLLACMIHAHREYNSIKSSFFN
jgi:HD-like signal output (HDOD) protein